MTTKKLLCRELIGRRVRLKHDVTVRWRRLKKEQTWTAGTEFTITGTWRGLFDLRCDAGSNPDLWSGITKLHRCKFEVIEDV